MQVLPLVIHERAINKFKREAKRVFPLESWGYILGHETLDALEIVDIWLPEDIEKYAKVDRVDPPKHWPIKVLEYCEEHDITALGSIHSHPYTYAELQHKGYKAHLPDHSTSESDALYGLTTRLHAICRILESRTGRLRATIKFWGPELPVQEQYVK